MLDIQDNQDAPKYYFPVYFKVLNFFYVVVCFVF